MKKKNGVMYNAWVQGKGVVKKKKRNIACCCVSMKKSLRC